MSVKLRRCLFVCLLLTINLSVLANSQHQIVYNMPSKVQSDYMQGLLKMALKYSGKNYTYTTTSETYSRLRAIESLKSGELTVMWGGTSEQLEQDFIPIRIDAYRGLMSHRVLLIRKGDQARFDRVQSLSDLQQISMGQVRAWQDADILEKSGFKVVKIGKKQGLFYMLDGARFDAFPRGANEAWNEMAAFPDLSLAVEQKLVLVYPLPTYFFVTPHRKDIARDLENGLESAIKDGAFENYFYNSKDVREVLKTADLPNRKAFHIANPFLPKATPLDRKELWVTMDDLRKKTEELNLNQ